MVDGMVLGPFSKAVPDAKTPQDWLSVNPENVEKYREDPLCGARFTLGSYAALFSLIKLMGEAGKYEEVWKELPILMISARQLPEDRKRGFLVGTDDYMTKPLDEEELLLHIKALLRRAKIVSERRIVVGDAVLDYDSMTVRRGNEVQELPQKEFLLLYKLLSYPGKIFTRIQLMDEIWGAESDTGWETVTVHIGRLRKRFEHWNEFSIESVRGLGYKAVKHG
jgi:DNA-binding response OmpR family regulator